MFELLLEQIARELDRRAIPYMVIGGQAVLIHGEPRLTADIDITLGIDIDRLDTILELARRSGWHVLVDDPKGFAARTMVLPCEDAASGIRIDLIFSNSDYERQAMTRCQSVRLGTMKVRFASAEDLVVHKIIAGRPRDLEDVRTVLLKNPGIDRLYVQRWLSEFEAVTGEPLMARFIALNDPTED